MWLALLKFAHTYIYVHYDRGPPHHEPKLLPAGAPINKFGPPTSLIQNLFIISNYSFICIVYSSWWEALSSGEVTSVLSEAVSDTTPLRPFVSPVRCNALWTLNYVIRTEDTRETWTTNYELKESGAHKLWLAATSSRLWQDPTLVMIYLNPPSPPGRVTFTASCVRNERKPMHKFSVL
jgi:hypothetical protein